MADRRMVMPLPKDTFKADSTYQDSDGAITFRNSPGNVITAMISGEYKIAPYKGTASREELEEKQRGFSTWSAVGPVDTPPDPTATDMDFMSITGSINGHKVAVAYIDGFDIEKDQPLKGSVKQGENLFMGDAGEYLKVKIAVDGKFVTPQEAAALIGGIAYREDEAAAIVEGRTPDDVMTVGKDESKDSGGGGLVELGVKAGIAWGLYKLFF